MSSDFNLLQCNPATLKETHSTCLPQDMLLRLRDAWNDRFPTAPIPTSLRRKDDIWAALRLRMQNQYRCATEFCALKELGTTDVIEHGKHYFRPEKPTSWNSDPDEWLDTLTIARVMEQYEAAYPSFEFIGPVPIDFDKILPGGWGKCVVDELCSLDLHAVRRRGDKSVGVIFNLDPHDKDGSHWVCAYVDLVAGAAYYYDSYGMPPCPEIKRFLRRCKEQGCSEVKWNTKRHQRKQSECGMYCMYFIISLLNGRTFDDVCTNRVDDDTMLAIRDLLYATERPSKEAITKGSKLLRP